MALMTSPRLFSQTRQSPARATENIMQLMSGNARHDWKTGFDVCNLWSFQRAGMIEKQGSGDAVAVCLLYFYRNASVVSCTIATLAAAGALTKKEPCSTPCTLPVFI